VATPIGHRGDLSPRAVESLRAADLVMAEDTRTARALLRELGIAVPVRSCFDGNEAARAAEVAALLRDGKSVALVSEAGTPALSDPGFRVVRAAVDAGARVVPVPGPSAVLAALVGSGLPTDRFLFAGFPPRKEGARLGLFASLRPWPWTLVLYESPRRAAATLADLAAALGGDRRACVARELTKTHEELVRGTLRELADRYQAARPLGEVTLVVAGAGPGASAGHDGDRADTLTADSSELLADRARALLAQGRSPRDVARELAAQTGVPRREVYQIVTSLRTSGTLRRTGSKSESR